MSLYTNRQLFSDHWLRERLPDRLEYALTPLGLARFALWAWERAASTEGDGGGAATDAVTAGLRALGYVDGEWQRGRVDLWSEGALRWQVVLIRTAAKHEDAKLASDGGVLVAAIPPGAPFDERGQATVAAPSAQLLRLLAAADVGWGILSDGARWRLYRRGGDALEAYYEVDLDALAARRDVDVLKYFWLFFAAESHLPGDAGSAFLDTALAESRAYAAGIEDDLRVHAFDAISAACQALADALAAARGIPVALLSRVDLATVYADALALLYRLLFILYAESRALLPTEDPRYLNELGLRALIERLPGNPDAASRQPKAGEIPRGIWARLRRLFRALDDEQRPEYVPAFKGRLFDRDTHPLLRDLTLADTHLAAMLVFLGRTRDGRLIDYADLAVRQLGSIYEGLLEHQAIAVAEDEMVLVKGPKDKATVIVPLADAANRRVIERYPPGTVYLSNDKGERHAAGTYYTPEPVVRYLVDETLGPLVAGKRADEIVRLKVLDPAMGSGHFLVAAVDFLARAALAAEVAEAAAPTPHAARPPHARTHPASAKPAANAPPGDGTTASAMLDGGVLALKRRIAEQCIYGVDLNDAAVELAKLSLWLATAARGLPLTFLDAHLRAGNSLVGLAPGALEHAADPPATPTKRRRLSAKTSPRAASRTPVTSQATKSALAPATLRDGSVAVSPAAATQPALWDEGSFTQDMFRLVGGRQVIDLMDSRTAEDVRAKTHVLETLDPLAAPYRQLADLSISRDFGNVLAPELYAAAARTLLERGAARLPATTLAPALAEARRIAERQHAFHWELEFPEVFRDGLGRPLGASAGFDAVLGNPPYVSVGTLRAADAEAWANFPKVYQTAAQGKYDLYAAFVERGLALLNARGRLAYILPNKWLTTDAGAGLRGLLAARRAVRALVDFGAYPVFPGVSNYTCLLLAGRNATARMEVAQRQALEGAMDLPPRAASGLWALGEVAAGTLGDAAWDLTVGGAQDILDRLRDWPTLGAQATIFVGTCTNANPVFIVREQARVGAVAPCWSVALGRAVPLEAALLLPVLQGRDITPFACDDGGNRLLFPYRTRAGGADLLPADELRERYPLAWAYLNDPAVRTALEGREKGRFAGRADWYGYGRPQNMHLLAAPKLVLPDVAARGRAAFDGAGRAIMDTAYGVLVRTGNSYARHFLLAALNSPILTFYLRHRGTDLRGGYFRMKTRYLEPFPLPSLDWDQPADERRAHAAWALARIARGDVEGEAVDLTAAALSHLPSTVLHDVVASLAERAGELAADEREAWRGMAARVAALRPEQAPTEPVAALLVPPRPGADITTQTALVSALLAALEQTGPALTAPELMDLRDAGAAALAEARAAREAFGRATRLGDVLLYRLYGLDVAAIKLVEGAQDTLDEQVATDSASATGTGKIAKTGKPAKPAKRRSVGRGVPHDAERERDEVREAEETGDAMRTVSKGGQPRNILTCLDVALERPYCAQGEMNQAMNYVEFSSTGSNYVALAWLAGLLDEHPSKGWLRPRAEGRAVVRVGAGLEGETARDAQISMLWDALLALPGLRRFLESELIELEATARAQAAAQGDEIRAIWQAELPVLAGRVAYLEQLLRLEEASLPQVRHRLATLESLEPLAATAARELAATLGLVGGLSRLTRAQRIAEWLVRASSQPVWVDAAWLKPEQVLALVLLSAARERGLGCVVSRAGTPGLVPAIEALARGGVDVRLEVRSGGAKVAALAQPLALYMRDMASLEALAQRTRGTPLAPGAGLLLAAVGWAARPAADGLARGTLDLGELAQACMSELRDAVGEPAAHPAATEWSEPPSRVTIGPPLPLPSDLSHLDLNYTFLDEAVRVRVGQARPGVAVLLTEWLLRREETAEVLLACNPHLALLYLIAADTGAQAELLGRSPDGWTLDGSPLVTALDVRLRALGYEVWDERYAGNAAALGALSEGLVQQGLRAGILRMGGATSLLDAPDSHWYFKAIDLLAVAPAGRSAR